MLEGRDPVGPRPFSCPYFPRAPVGAVVATDPASVNADCDNGGGGIPRRGPREPDGAGRSAVATGIRVAREAREEAESHRQGRRS